ncbi:hypothetical protein GOV04_03815 [Candidatus Woesearchaeota archaeon]|nr:hypothetical protein [Candidatus Woesearchaeota archaeon]
MNLLKDLLKGIKDGFKYFGENIAIIVNTILLLGVYIFGVGLTSITAKLFRKTFLPRQNKKNKTYWQELNLETKPIEEYYRQF